jgi:hypothetical protein
MYVLAFVIKLNLAQLVLFIYIHILLAQLVLFFANLQVFLNKPIYYHDLW